MKSFILFVLAIYTTCGTQLSFSMEIVRNGKPIAGVVITEAVEPLDYGGFEMDKRAAKVLIDWIKKMTDAQLPIRKDIHEDEPAIYIGAAALNRGLKLEDIKCPSREGFRIESDGKHVLLAAQNGISTVKAVCRFLEELGCRYFMDHPLGEVYPRIKDLSVGPLKITEKPLMFHRRIWGSNWGGETLWKVWNGDGGLPLSPSHAWGKYVPKELLSQHPEYFRLRDGERKQSDWYCTSNLGLREVFTKGVSDQIRKGNLHPSLSPPDGREYCQCDTCKAQDDSDSTEPSSGHVSITNRYLDFYQHVAREVAKVSPESILNFYCYADYTQPPSNGIKLESNLCAWLAPIRYCRYHPIGHPRCPSRQQFEKVIDGWAQAANKIAYRTYNFNLAECVVPFSMLSVWKHDIPYLHRKGCTGISLETLANWQIYGPHIYLSIRLAYNPEAEADAIMDDYFMKFYGPKAGPVMKQYWMAIDEAFDGLESHSGSFYALHRVYTPDFLKRCQSLVEKARSAAKEDEQYTARVEMAAEGLKNAVQYIQLRDAVNSGEIGTAKKVYDDLLSRSEAHRKTGLGNHYTVNYLKRFIGTHLEAAVNATALPNQLLQVLPDRWRFKVDESDVGVKEGYYRTDLEDQSWKEVATYTDTLDAQGLPDRQTILWYRTAFDLPHKPDRLSLLFMEVDGVADVYLNGKKVGEKAKSRQPFEVDVSEAAVEGRNVIAVRVDHSRITELFLGGMIKPVFLIKTAMGR